MYIRTSVHHYAFSSFNFFCLCTSPFFVNRLLYLLRFQSVLQVLKILFDLDFWQKICKVSLLINVICIAVYLKHLLFGWSISQSLAQTCTYDCLVLLLDFVLHRNQWNHFSYIGHHLVKRKGEVRQYITLKKFLFWYRVLEKEPSNCSCLKEMNVYLYSYLTLWLHVPVSIFN